MTVTEMPPAPRSDPLPGGGGFFDSGVPRCLGEPPALLPGSAIAGQVGVLDGGVPWPRLASELDEQWDRLLIRLAEALGAGDRPVEAMDGAGRFVLGVWTAAAWTLGHSPAAPISRADRAVTGPAIQEELAAAGQLVVGRRPYWEWATGVLEWLLWITGARETLRYPGR